MELLKSFKTPSNYKYPFGNVKVSVHSDVSKENGDRIIAFLDLLNKKIPINDLNIVQENPVKLAIKLDKTIKLTQMSSSEIEALEEKIRKQLDENDPIKNTGNTENNEQEGVPKEEKVKEKQVEEGEGEEDD